MTLEEIKKIQTTATVAPATDLLVVAKVDNKTPQSITAADLLTAAVGALPTSDPSVVGALWLNSGVLTVSAGA